MNAGFGSEWDTLINFKQNIFFEINLFKKWAEF
jgi:hypothetical protein